MIALLRREKSTGVLVEFRAQLIRRHWILGRASVVFFHFFERASIFKHNLGGALEAAWARIIRVDVIMHAARQREDLGISAALGAIGSLAERTVEQRLRQTVLQTHAPVR